MDFDGFWGILRDFDGFWGILMDFDGILMDFDGILMGSKWDFNGWYGYENGL
jgi:hypothetical protein